MTRIICVEGASSVGKSISCMELAKRFHAYVVPETAFLFEAPRLEGRALMLWLLERQADRWTIAAEKSKEYEFVILDGDIYKTWYNWIFGYDGVSLEETAQFFKEKIRKREMLLPDAYILLWNEEHVLRERKEADATRTRRNFDKHLQLIGPQMRYFTYLNDIVPGYVGIYKADTVDRNVANMIEHSQSAPSMKGKEIEIFNKMIDFYRHNQP